MERMKRSIRSISVRRLMAMASSAVRGCSCAIHGGLCPPVCDFPHKLRSLDRPILLPALLHGLGKNVMVLAVVRFTAIVALLWALPAVGQSAPAWLAALQAGGHVIVLRHGATYADQADTNPLDLKDTAHQRQLNDAGRAAAKAMGDALH